MPPFAQFRVWLREGPLAEKVLAGVVGAVVLALVGLALVPVHGASNASVEVGVGTAPILGNAPPSSGPTVGSQTGGSSPGNRVASSAPGGTSTASGGTGGNSALPGPVGGPSAGPAPASDANPGSPTITTAPVVCGPLTSSAPGVTPTQVHIDFAYVDLAGPVGDSLFGIRQDIGQIVTAVVNAINRAGGVGCGRKFSVTQYKVNPIDSNDQQTKCLEMSQNNALAAINDAGYVTPVSEQCFVANHLPLESVTSIGAQQGAASYPYLFSPLASSEQQVRDGVLGLAARGYFKAPQFAGKLGVFEDNCLPSANQEIGRDLATSGVKSNQISTYAINCALIGSPTQISQAVLQNKQAGDTQVFLGSTISNNQNYVKTASQQGFHPHYLLSDYGSSEAPGQQWDNGFDGAIDITSTRSGELDSGIKSPVEQTCIADVVAGGIKAPTSGATDGGVGEICDMLFLLAQAIRHAGPNPTRTSLVEDLSSLGPFKSAYSGDSNWNQPRQVTGGSYQRAIKYQVSCQCWKVVDPTFGPAY